MYPQIIQVETLFFGGTLCLNYFLYLPETRSSSTLPTTLQSTELSDIANIVRSAPAQIRCQVIDHEISHAHQVLTSFVAPMQISLIN